MIVEPALVDVDNDNFDDGCDGQIGLPKPSGHQNTLSTVSRSSINSTNIIFGRGKTSILDIVSSSVLGANAVENSNSRTYKIDATLPKTSGRSSVDWATIGIAVCLLGSLLYVFGRSGVDRHKHLQ